MGHLQIFFYLAFVAVVAFAQKGSKRPSKQTISKNDGRIIGGVEADTGKFAFVVSLQYSATRHHFCGGSIISPEWILTAAHCVDELPSGSRVQVVAGTANNKLETEVTQKRGVASIVIHKNWSRQTPDSDIALIKLQSPLSLGGNIRAVQLDHTEFSYPDYLSIAGWGKTHMQNPSASDMLMATAAPGITREECQAIHRNYKVITQAMICSNFDVGNYFNPCQGDSGSPAMSFYTGKQVGIASWIVQCGHTGYPAVYTNVAWFIPWIQSVTGLAV